MNQDARPSALSLPGLLNILYRGRRLVLYATLAGLLAGVAYSVLTTPLYRATAQVRPGIVSYSDMGAPLREWAIKDIVRWFRTMLYWEDLREQERFAAKDGPPVIAADYIPSGPQFQQGGDVITLTALDPDPLLAAATLREAVASFNRQASLDSLGSTMHLTMGGTRVRMAKIRNDVAHVEAEKQRAELEIAERERQLTQLDAEDRRLELRIERLQSARAWRERAVETVTEGVAQARERLAEAQRLLARVMETEQGEPAPARTGDAETDLLLQVARREQAGRVGELLDTVDALAERVTAGAVEADTLRHGINAIDTEIAALRLEREIDLAKRKADVGQEIAGLRIELERDLPHRQAQLEADWRGEKVRLDLLTPLEQIGRISVSEKPVRPRRLRATAILAALGLCSGVFLALAREYYRRNRDLILAAGD